MTLATGTVKADEVASVVGDTKLLPAAQRKFQSASGRFVLTLSNFDAWSSKHVEAELVESSGAVQRARWRLILPHEMGPRWALVTDDGATILVDEWINIPSRHAVMLLDPSGQMLADYSIDQLIELLKITRKTIAAHARLGPWLTSAPTLCAGGASVEFRVGGRGLSLELANGRLSVTK